MNNCIKGNHNDMKQKYLIIKNNKAYLAI